MSEKEITRTSRPRKMRDITIPPSESDKPMAGPVDEPGSYTKMRMMKLSHDEKANKTIGILAECLRA
jgi:hypothetical protein